MLDIKNLLVRRGEGALAHHVRLPHLQVGAGEILAITGESGSGKSTLLEAIGLLLAPVELERFRLGATHDPGTSPNCLPAMTSQPWRRCAPGIWGSFCRAAACCRS